MMRARLTALTLLLVIWGVDAQADDPPYYLALGDSLAVGVQPSAGGFIETNRGYVDVLYAFYRTRIPGLRLQKLGCSGDTASAMISGFDSACYDESQSQLSAAVQFLQTHRVELVTIDIGGDDILQCFDLSAVPPIDLTCVQQTVVAVNNYLVTILTTLRDADSDVLIVGMNYYDPFQAAWFFGPQGRALALASLPLTLQFNGALQTVYQLFDVPVADVARAFRITNTTPLLGIPTNALLALLWTWMGAPPPVGPDVHPNAIGYAVIAGAFVRAIESP
jgi:lysophospholipase L1-like esterase